MESQKGRGNKERKKEGGRGTREEMKDGKITQQCRRRAFKFTKKPS